jgi:hypothetical protein
MSSSSLYSFHSSLYFVIMRSKSIIYAAGMASAGILCTSVCRIRIATAFASGLFEEFDSRCAVVIEDGMYQDQDKDVVSTGNASSSSTIASLLRPILDTTIVPWAREICNTPSLTVADALIRSRSSRRTTGFSYPL